MPSVSLQLTKILGSCVVMVYSVDERGVSVHHEVMFMPCAINMASIRWEHKENGELVMGYHLHDGHQLVKKDIPGFNQDTVHLWRMRAQLVISCFHDLYVGDIKFLCTALGMNNSDKDHCMCCERKATEFNGDVLDDELRSEEKFYAAYHEYCAQIASRKKIANFKGRNTKPLIA